MSTTRDLLDGAPETGERVTGIIAALQGPPKNFGHVKADDDRGDVIFFYSEYRSPALREPWGQEGRAKGEREPPLPLFFSCLAALHLTRACFCLGGLA